MVMYVDESGDTGVTLPRMNKPGDLVRIGRDDRLTILRAMLDELTKLPTSR
jgi:hypothetical protein